MFLELRLVLVVGWSEGSLGALDGVVIAYSADAGAKVWNARNEGSPGSAVGLTRDGGTLLIAETGTIAYAPATGEELWTASAGGYALATSDTSEGSLVFVTNRESTTALAV